jgi:hypothetical protein
MTTTPRYQTQSVACLIKWESMLQGDRAMEAMKISKRKGGDTGCHPAAPELLVVQCSSAVMDDGGVQPERVNPPPCTPWTYINAYGCASDNFTYLQNVCFDAGTHK